MGISWRLKYRSDGPVAVYTGQNPRHRLRQCAVKAARSAERVVDENAQFGISANMVKAHTECFIARCIVDQI